MGRPVATSARRGVMCRGMPVSSLLQVFHQVSDRACFDFTAGIISPGFFHGGRKDLPFLLNHPAFQNAHQILLLLEGQGIGRIEHVAE